QSWPRSRPRYRSAFIQNSLCRRHQTRRRFNDAVLATAPVSRLRARSAALRSSRLTRWFTLRGMIMDLSCSKCSGSRESKKRPPTVLPAHSVVHLARHDHGLELLKVLRISTPTPRGQEAQLD